MQTHGLYYRPFELVFLGFLLVVCISSGLYIGKFYMPVASVDSGWSFTGDYAGVAVGAFLYMLLHRIYRAFGIVEMAFVIAITFTGLNILLFMS